MIAETPGLLCVSHTSMQQGGGGRYMDVVSERWRFKALIGRREWNLKNLSGSCACSVGPSEERPEKTLTGDRSKL